jgi:hypothetical protein
VRRSHTLKIVAFLSILSAFSFPLHAAEIYRWVDSNGIVHYTDDAPEGIQETKVLKVPDPDRKTDSHTNKSKVFENNANIPPQTTKDPEALHRINHFRISRQDGPWYALATIEMIAQYYGFSISQIQVSLESDIPRDQGMSLNAMLKYFDRLKILMLDVEHHYGGSLDAIKPLIDSQIPVIWLHRSRQGERWGDYHSAVVIGYDDTQRVMRVADPACGCEIALPYREFLTRWQKTDNLYVVVTSRL